GSAHPTAEGQPAACRAGMTSRWRVVLPTARRGSAAVKAPVRIAPATSTQPIRAKARRDPTTGIVWIPRHGADRCRLYESWPEAALAEMALTEVRPIQVGQGCPVPGLGRSIVGRVIGHRESVMSLVELDSVINSGVGQRAFQQLGLLGGE